MSRPLAIAAGGTGGHMFPALALAAELERRGREVLLLTDARGARFAGDYPIKRVMAASPSGNLLAKASAAVRLGVGIAQSYVALRRARPGALAAFGGYASIPPALAATRLRLPYVLHEQNAVLGRANRLIARQSRRVALAFDATRGLPPGIGAVDVVGNPVRPGFAAGARAPAPSPTADGDIRLLIMGGSQGAKVFSDLVPAALEALPEAERKRLRVVQQCRPEDLERVRAAYVEAGIEAELASFFNDVPARMRAAHLLVSRSGASTIAELLYAGKPAVLVPYPHAADDHQHANAKALADAGAAHFFLQSGLDAERLTREFAALIANPTTLDEMAQAARMLARPEAAERLADMLLEVELKGSL